MLRPVQYSPPYLLRTGAAEPEAALVTAEEQADRRSAGGAQDADLAALPGVPRPEVVQRHRQPVDLDLLRRQREGRAADAVPLLLEVLQRTSALRVLGALVAGLAARGAEEDGAGVCADRFHGGSVTRRRSPAAKMAASDRNQPFLVTT
ncbi:hypothetical protein SCOCK_660017 [Actinacidiphila cocklensis]|uniref:Uncharacterized protein n=1 Tax=Actinacidiphila cocklensis TaxID=887465 RepID=A0A9W4DYH2_9ACTN|nr:hypothetical protein SCOCK_660017 [Actinacidiphila cocklensis]